MKNLTFPIMLLVLGASIFFQSCSTTNECDGDCLFSGKDLQAEVIYLNCFGQFGLICEHPQIDDNVLVAIPGDLSKRYQTAGIKVRFNGGFHENKLVPNMQFPDPDIILSEIYQVDIWQMESVD